MLYQGQVNIEDNHVSENFQESNNDLGNFKNKIYTHYNPLCIIGLISDIQYADLDEILSFNLNKRYYRNSLKCLKNAVENWNKENLDFVINCGDIVDLRNAGKANEAFYHVKRILSNLKYKVYHLLGNHCVACFNRQFLLSGLDLKNHIDNNKNDFDDIAYYKIDNIQNWKILMLDTSDICIYYPKLHPKFKKAKKILDEHNPNEDKFNLNGLDVGKRRFNAVNGAIGHEQLKWMEKELSLARSENKKCIVFHHIPLMAPSNKHESAILWNNDEILEIYKKFNDVVRASICGHTHSWSYQKDESGIHHVILPGVVETEPGKDGHGTLLIYEDKLVLRGFERKDDLIME